MNSPYVYPSVVGNSGGFVNPVSGVSVGVNANSTPNYQQDVNNNIIHGLINLLSGQQTADILTSGQPAIAAHNVLTDVNSIAQPFVDIGNRLNNGVFWLNVGGLIIGSVVSLMAVKEIMSMGK